MRVDVSLEKRGPAGGRSAGRLVPPPDPEPGPVPDPVSAPEPEQEGQAAGVPEPGPVRGAATGPEAEPPGGPGPSADPAGPGDPPPPPDPGAVPAEVFLRIPLWWSDGGRANAAPPTPPRETGTRRDDDGEQGEQGEQGDPGEYGAYDDDGGPAHAEQGQPFAWAFDGTADPPMYSSRGRRILWILGGAAAAAAVVAVALVLGSEEKAAKPPNGPRSTAPPAPAAAPPGPASAYVPRALALGGFENKVQVTWQPPERVGEVVGFIVVAQSREGAVLEHRLVPAGETSAVFAAPPMTRDGCVVVATLVRGPTGVTPVGADPVCR
ncbi:hypothetical protein OG216_31845 [Streptomycetaceae bacterium NBC_01309]